MKKVVIIGGGFGGLNAAKALKNKNLEITLIDKTNHHLFQPLLYQVATAALSPADIAVPIRSVLNKYKTIKVILGEVKRIDVSESKVYVENLFYEYDYLIIAIGSRHSYFGNDVWEKFAPGLKTVSDALNIREKILLSFEKAERTNNQNEISKNLTFVIVGGGPTGVELVGAIAEITKRSMLKDFRNIDPSKTRIILVEAFDRILNSFDGNLSEIAKKNLEELGAEVLLNKKVTMINEGGVQIENDFYETSNVIWAAGNTISPLLDNLGIELDKAGRAVVENDCSVKAHPEIFVIGDAALFVEEGKPLPAIAPVAIQQGKYIGKIISKNLPKENRKPFRYFDKGTIATIGKTKAVAQIWKLKLHGFLAWVIWSFIHIMYLIDFRNRYRVMVEWIWLFFTNRNGIRLIVNRKDDQ